MTSVPAPLLKYASPKTAATHMAETEAGASGVVRGSSALSTAGDMMYTPIVDELQSALTAKELGTSTLEALRQGKYSEAAGQGGLTALAILGAVPFVGTPARVANQNIISKIFKNKPDDLTPAKNITGLTPNNQDTYSSIEVPMNREEFLRHTTELPDDQVKDKTIQYVKNQITKAVNGDSPEAIAGPMIQLKWDKKKKDWVANKNSHEGRHRVKAVAEELGEDTQLPVVVGLYNHNGNKVPLHELYDDDIRPYATQDNETRKLMRERLDEWKKHKTPAGLNTKGQKVFHSTSSGQAIIDSDVFNPVSNVVTADVGIHVGSSPLTSNNAAFHTNTRKSLEAQKDQIKQTIERKKAEGFNDFRKEDIEISGINKKLKEGFKNKTSFPLRLDPNLKPLYIPDMGAFKYPRNWLELLDSYEVTIKPEILKDLKEAAKDVLQQEQFQRDFVVAGKKVNYWDTGEGKGVWLNKLRQVGKKHNFDSFKYKNYTEGHHQGIPEEDAEDSIMLMYPRQVKFDTTKEKNWKDKRASKQKGGMIKTPSSYSPSKGSNVMRNPYNYEPKAI